MNFLGKAVGALAQAGVDAVAQVLAEQSARRLVWAFAVLAAGRMLLAAGGLWEDIFVGIVGVGRVGVESCRRADPGPSGAARCCRLRCRGASGRPRAARRGWPAPAPSRRSSVCWRNGRGRPRPSAAGRAQCACCGALVPSGYSSTGPVGGIKRTTTTIAWDSSLNRWKVVQLFPEARTTVSADYVVP